MTDPAHRGVLLTVGDGGAPDPPEAGPADAAAALRSLALLPATAARLREALAASVDRAMYWQPPDGEDALAAHPAVTEALADAAALIAASSAAAWWTSPVDLGDQWAVPWEGAWRGVDHDGVLFRDYAEKPDLPLVEASASTPASALAEAAAVVEGLPADLVDRLETVEVGSIDDIVLQLRGGAQVRWGSADEADRKEQVLALLMRQPAQVYDVTAPGRPTIKR